MAEGESPFSYLHDHLGSPIRLMGDGQEETLAYDEFGVPTVEATQNGKGSLNNPFGFTGYQLDDVSGLYFAQARYYEPKISRFVSEDTVRSISQRMPNGQEMIDPLSLNLYNYCANNPIMHVDPSGHYYIVEEKDGSYSIIHESMGTVFTSAMAAIFMPFGRTIAKRAARHGVGNVIGGTSVFAEGYVNNATDILGYDDTYAYIFIPLSILGPLNSAMKGLDMATIRGTIYDLDRTLFGMMDIAGMNTTGFDDLETLVSQLSFLHAIIDDHPNYFGTYGSGFYGQFMEDYKLYNMSKYDRTYAIMRSVGFSMWDSMQNMDQLKNDPKYQKALSEYKKRIIQLKSWLKECE